MIDYGALLSAVSREVIEECHRPSCISAVAALIDVAAEFRVTLRTLRVKAIIFNPHLTELVGDFSAHSAAEKLERYTKEKNCVRAFLGVPGVGSLRDGDWPGHLVAVADEVEPGFSLVLDATLQQADSPTHGIVLRPTAIRVPTSNIDGKFRTRINDCEIMYMAMPGDAFHESTQIWTDQPSRRRIRDRVLSRLESA